MTLLQPIWLILIPAVFMLGYVVKSLSLFTPLRMVIVILVAIALAQPMLNSNRRALDLYVLVDRSDSVGDRMNQSLPEWRKILQQEKPSRDDRLLFVDYASEVMPHDTAGMQASYSGGRNLTIYRAAL